MRVLLVEPSLQRGDGGKGGVRALMPPLGLITVAGLTPPEVEVELVDEASRAVDFDYPADLVGISATTATAPRAYQIAHEFRERGVPVALGGIHATALPEEALQHVDVVCRGEAEGFWVELLEDAEKGSLKRVYENFQPDLARTSAKPRRDLLNFRDYVLFNNVQTTRGCPMDCSFCSVTKFYGRQYRTRPIGQVVEEVEELPPGMVVFVDDNILGDPEYSGQLFEALVPLKREWMSQASLNRLGNDGLLELAARSGCRALFVGVESISQENLRQVHKSFNKVEQFGEIVERLHRHGIGMVGAFIFGLDEDDESVFEGTVEFAEENKVDVAQFAIRIPLPGTRDAEELEKAGRIFDRDWSHYNGTRVVFSPRKLSAVALQRGLDWAYKRFYSLSSIWRRMWGHHGAHKSLCWKMNLAFKARIKGLLRRAKERLEPLLSLPA